MPEIVQLPDALEEKRNSKYVQDLKKENSELRKMILDKNKELDELKGDMQFLMEVVRMAGKEACEMLSIEATPENIEEYVDELCAMLEEGTDVKTS